MDGRTNKCFLLSFGLVRVLPPTGEQTQIISFPVTQVTSQLEAASQADVVFVAIFPEHHSTLLELKTALAGKILVDVSNSSQIKRAGPSHAERLADMFPESFIVKGFNTISAWVLQTGSRDGSRQVGLLAILLYL